MSETFKASNGWHIDLAELEKFTDQWANNPHNGDTIYSLAWMEGPESARTEASATLTVSGLLALIACLRDAEARIEKMVRLRDRIELVRDEVIDLAHDVRETLSILTEGDEQ